MGRFPAIYYPHLAASAIISTDWRVYPPRMLVPQYPRLYSFDGGGGEDIRGGC